MGTKKIIKRGLKVLGITKTPRLDKGVAKVKRGLAALGVTTLPKLDERLSGLERVFIAPPLTPELVAAIKLISPHFELPAGKKFQERWEADQNGACWGEYEALTPLFNAMPRPAKVLEIGPGMGRSLVFFSKKLHWEKSEIHAYEGDGTSTKYTLLGPRFEDSFCGNIDVLRYVLEFNAINNVRIFNARDIKIAQLPGPYNLIYSFFCIGFHWSLEHFLDDLMRIMDDQSVALFTVPSHFVPFPKLDAFSYRIIEWKTAWPKDGRQKLLVLGRKSIPKF